MTKPEIKSELFSICEQAVSASGETHSFTKSSHKLVLLLIAVKLHKDLVAAKAIAAETGEVDDAAKAAITEAKASADALFAAACNASQLYAALVEEGILKKKPTAEDLANNLLADLEV